MAEVTTSSCCAFEAQEACCEPEAKDECRGAGDGSCGCGASAHRGEPDGSAVRERVRER